MRVFIIEHYDVMTYISADLFFCTGFLCSNGFFQLCTVLVGACPPLAVSLAMHTHHISLFVTADGKLGPIFKVPCSDNFLFGITASVLSASLHGTLNRALKCCAAPKMLAFEFSTVSAVKVCGVSSKFSHNTFPCCSEV